MHTVRSNYKTTALKTKLPEAAISSIIAESTASLNEYPESCEVNLMK